MFFFSWYLESFVVAFFAMLFLESVNDDSSLPGKKDRSCRWPVPFCHFEIFASAFDRIKSCSSNSMLNSGKPFKNHEEFGSCKKKGYCSAASCFWRRQKYFKSHEWRNIYIYIWLLHHRPIKWWFLGRESNNLCEPNTCPTCNNLCGSKL